MKKQIVFICNKGIPGSGTKAVEFPWGNPVAVHEISNYSIVEYFPREGTIRKEYHVYIDGEDTNRHYDTLDRALIGAIAQRWSEAQHADVLAIRMLGVGK